MARATKAERASATAERAVGLFTAAHSELSNAIRDLAEAEQEHREHAAGHVEWADSIKEERESHLKIHAKLSELLGR